ncbi:MAG: FeoB-associated Cys-rich membrane protein [Clostridia bacterium]|nr:FeoB-associated Cys-rich membrane protein [Clostridia bacterium]
MFAWIVENLATIIVMSVLILITALIIAHMIRSKKNGKSSCGGNCGGCSCENRRYDSLCRYGSRKRRNRYFCFVIRP